MEVTKSLNKVTVKAIKINLASLVLNQFCKEESGCFSIIVSLLTDYKNRSTLLTGVSFCMQGVDPMSSAESAYLENQSNYFSKI